MGSLTDGGGAGSGIGEDGGLTSDGGFDPGADGGGDLDGGGEGDAGTGDDGGTSDRDAGTPLDAGQVLAFIAQGHLARTTVSCDLGRTWVANRDEAPANARCWQRPPGGTEIECDHQPTTARGIGFGRAHVIAHFGWGPPGTVRRSRDGVTWETVQSGKTYAGAVNVDGRVLLASATPSITDDDGDSFREVPFIGGLGTVRRGGGGDLDGSVFLLSGDDGVAVNRMGGLEGWQVRNPPAACRSGLTQGGIAVGNGVIVIAGGSGVCVSRDRGDTFQVVNAGGSVGSTLVWTGTHFVFLGQAQGGGRARFQSSDGETWTATPTTVQRTLADGGMSVQPGPPVAVMGYGGGTFVGVNDEWQRWYEQQAFFRSEDGITWEALPPTAFTGSHPITHFAFGPIDRGAACP